MTDTTQFNPIPAIFNKLEEYHVFYKNDVSSGFGLGITDDVSSEPLYDYVKAIHNGVDLTIADIKTTAQLRSHTKEYLKRCKKTSKKMRKGKEITAQDMLESIHAVVFLLKTDQLVNDNFNGDLFKWS